MRVAYRDCPSSAGGSVLKFVLRRDGWMFRICRLIWTAGNVGNGEGYSAKFSLALYPSLIGFSRGWHEWTVYALGLRLHFQKSYGGYHT